MSWTRIYVLTFVVNLTAFDNKFNQLLFFSSLVIHILPLWILLSSIYGLPNRDERRMFKISKFHSEWYLNFHCVFFTVVGLFNYVTFPVSIHILHTLCKENRGLRKLFVWPCMDFDFLWSFSMLKLNSQKIE